MSRSLPLPDGHTLHVHTRRPAGDPWLHVLVVHGVAEHSGRYARTMDLLADAGIAVAAYDHRGHGRSSGGRGHVDGWEDLTGDVGRMLAEVRSGAADHPVAILAHSMGGLIALDAVLAGRAAPDLLVLSAPGLGDALPGWQHALAPVVAAVAPRLRFPNAWDGSVLSRDPSVAAAAAADPLNLRAVTARLGAGGFAAQKRVNAAVAGLPAAPLPTLVLHGTDDRLVPPRATEALGRLPGVSRRLYPGLRHELLNEPEGSAIVADIVGWLRDADGQPGG
ncbi:MAG: alpha/beta fold hydrolase [Chloroflexota bacterium]